MIESWSRYLDSAREYLETLEVKKGAALQADSSAQKCRHDIRPLATGHICTFDFSSAQNCILSEN
jgi:hypothetical protein